MMHLSLMFDARARTGPGSRTRGKTPSKSTIGRIRRAQKKLAQLGEVDVLTAGDNDVCPVCEAISEDGPYDLDTAEDLIPAHPYCRCAFVPAGTLTDAFDPDQPRDPQGRWSGGGSTQFAYHGTTQPFERFSQLGEPQEKYNPDRMLGYHFAKDPAISNSFAMERINEEERGAKEGGHIIPVTIPADERMLEATQPQYEWAAKEGQPRTNRNIETDEVAIQKMIAREAYPSHPEILAKFLESRTMKPDEARVAAKTIAEGGTAHLPIDGPHNLERIVNNFLGGFPSDTESKRTLVRTARESWQKKGYKGIKYVNTSPMETMPSSGIKDPTSYVVFDPRDVRGRYTGDYNPYHAPAGSPEGGQFTSGEGVGAGSAGGGIESLVQHISSDPPFDPKVVDVGGDEWNRQTALRLEREYQNAKPELEKIAAAAIEGPSWGTKVGEPPPGDDDDDESEYVPESWDEINDTKQEEIKNDWMEKTADEFLQMEIHDWQEGGDALDDTKGTLAYYLENHKGHENNQYALDALNELRDERKEEREQEIPFTNEQLMDAMSFDYETGYQGWKDVDIDWDDTKLGLPKGWVSEQGTLPGIEPIQPSSKLTKEMREAIEAKLVKAFNDEADNKVGDAEPPEYLKDNVGEYQDMSWDNKSDKEKFKWAQDNGHIESPDEEPKQITLNKMPDKIDPLGENDKSRDYKLTKLLAGKMSVARAADMMVQRGVFKERANALRAAHDFDNRLWKAWKGDSGSTDGMILQAATAAELGGRFRNKQGIPFDARDLEDAGYKQQAKERFGSAGGWAGLLAYIRAKWETSQYLLDKANKPEVDVYRGILLKDKGREEEMKIPQSGYNFPFHFTRLPELPLNRSGAQSTTADISVANTWKGVGAAAGGFKPEDDRVVFRMRVPRTAVLSLPAYGQNVYGEHEVVLAGTAWKKWDAWLHHAPKFEEFSMKDAQEMQ